MNKIYVIGGEEITKVIGDPEHPTMVPPKILDIPPYSDSVEFYITVQTTITYW